MRPILAEEEEEVVVEGEQGRAPLQAISTNASSSRRLWKSLQQVNTHTHTHTPVTFVFLHLENVLHIKMS